MKRLSNYTHARYCSDITDLEFGKQEITDEIEYRFRRKKPIPYFFYVRLIKIAQKTEKLKMKG
jgi:hypothetical protein